VPPRQGLYAAGHAGWAAIRRAIGPAVPVMGGALLMAGCAAAPDSANPVDWWHLAEGGRIAQERPPPPNADAPYPGLETVPKRPVPTDAATRGRIASGLVADRANAQYAGVGIVWPAAPGTPPASVRPAAPPPGQPAGQPGDDETPSASLQAANAPRPAPALPAPALPALAGESGSPAPPVAAPAGVPAAEVTLPAGPPPAPHIPGVEVPAVTAPAPPPQAPPPVPAPPASGSADAVLVAFTPGSAEIAPETQDALRALALRRGATPLAAIGYGEAAPGNLAAQSAALPLAMARARAIAAVLMASGVPSSQLRVEAEAEGPGGAARRVN